MGDLLSLYAYVRTYVHTNLSRSGMLIMLQVSCRSLSFICHDARVTTSRLRSVDERAVPPGLAELGAAIHMESNSEHCQHLFIPQIHKVLHSQRLGYKRAGPAELAQL